MAIFLGSVLFTIMFISSSAETSAATCGPCVFQSKVSFLSSASALSSGACGYGSLAPGFSGGNIAAAVPSIYKDGAGCGACFLIKCKNSKLCNKEGTKVVVTDLNKSNQTDFVLSPAAFRAMANKGMGESLLKQGIVDVDYQRIPCEYKNKNLSFRVQESSKKPDYLAILLLYQGGQTEISTIEIARVGHGEALWISGLSRNYGAVWDTDNVPTGDLQFRLRVTEGYDGFWIWARKAVLPADWKIGVVYDTGVKVINIAQDRWCYPCLGNMKPYFIQPTMLMMFLLDNLEVRLKAIIGSVQVGTGVVAHLDFYIGEVVFRSQTSNAYTLNYPIKHNDVDN